MQTFFHIFRLPLRQIKWNTKMVKLYQCRDQVLSYQVKESEKTLMAMVVILLLLLVVVVLLVVMIYVQYPQKLAEKHFMSHSCFSWYIFIGNKIC